MTHTDAHARLPSSCDVAFKEWSGVCEALGTGRQSILLRKGGIAEDAGVFRPDHEVFWLAPTLVHEQEQGLKPEARATTPAAAPQGVFVVDLLAHVEFFQWIDDEQSLSRISEFHVWRPETIHKRFHYRTPGLWLIDVRVFRRSEPILVEATSERRGCRSWFSLERAEETEGLQPVIHEDDAARRRSTILSLLSRTG